MNIEKTLRWGFLGGVFLIPFIPLIVTDSLFFPFITGKNFAFRILVELLLGGWVLLALFNPIYRIRFSWLLASITSFVGIIALADFFGENPGKSIWSNFERMEGLVTLVHLLAYFIVTVSVLNTEKLWNRFLNTSVGVSVFLGLYGLMQLAGWVTINQGGVRLDATFGNATYLAVYMLFHVFITAILLLRYEGSRNIRWIYGGIILLQFVIIYYTATRGAILGLMGGALLSALLIAVFGKGHKRIRQVSVGVIFAVLISVGGFALIKDSKFVENSLVLARFSEISFSENVVNARFVVWGMALEGIKERPILGWGQENFNFVFNTYYDPLLYAQEAWFDRVHNIVFDWLIAGGIFGFLAYISMFLAALYYVWRRQATHFSIIEKSLLTGLLAGYTFHNLFVFDNIVSYIFFFTILSYICFASNEKKDVSGTPEYSGGMNSGVLTRLYVPLVVVVTLFTVYAVNGKPFLTAQAILQGLSSQPLGIVGNVAQFEKAIAYNSFLGTQEAREHLAQMATQIASNAQVQPEAKEKAFTTARSEMQKQIERIPNDARTQIFLGTLLDAYQQYEQARPYLESAHALSSAKQSILFQVALNQINRGEREKALATFKQAFELAPQFPIARIFYAIGALYVDDTQLLEELLIPEYGSIIVDDNRLLQAYFNNNRFNEVLEIWKLRVEKNPTNPQNHLGLAAAYLELNQRANSISAIEKAIELDPQFKDQGEYLIQEVRAGRNP